MGAKGFATKLPQDLREELDRLIGGGGLSVDDVWAWLRERDVQVGRSSVHRHMQSVEEVAAEMRQGREVAAAIVGSIGENAAEGKMGGLLIQVVQQIAFKTARARLTDPSGPGLDMEELMFLTSSIQKLSSAEKTDADLRIKVRAELVKESAKKLDAAGKAGEIDVDAIAKAKRILGFDA